MHAFIQTHSLILFYFKCECFLCLFSHFTKLDQFMAIAWVFHSETLYIAHSKKKKKKNIKLDWATGLDYVHIFYVRNVYKRNAGRCTLTIFLFHYIFFSSFLLLFCCFFFGSSYLGISGISFIFSMFATIFSLFFLSFSQSFATSIAFDVKTHRNSCTLFFAVRCDIDESVITRTLFHHVLMVLFLWFPHHPSILPKTPFFSIILIQLWFSTHFLAQSSTIANIVLILDLR